MFKLSFYVEDCSRNRATNYECVLKNDILQYVNNVFTLIDNTIVHGSFLIWI